MGRNDEPNDLFPVCVAVSADISQNIDIDYIPRGCCERCFQYVRCSFLFYCAGASISLQRQIIGSWGWSGLDLEVFLRRECGVCLSRGRRQHLPTPPPSVIFDPALKLKLYSSTPTFRTEGKMESGGHDVL